MNRVKAAILKNSKTSFEQIWDLYYSRITVFLQTTFQLTETEEIVQIIMIKIFRKLETYNPVYSFNTWIYTIARNSAIDEIKKNKNRDVVYEKIETGQLSDFRTFENETPEKILLLKEQTEMIEDFITALPAAEREITYLRFYEELKYSEISRITGSPVGTVKYHIHKVKEKFKCFYGEQYE